MAVIPFYGATNPELFAIERAAMDRSGRVLDHLDAHLPDGWVADIGAGDGFTAERLRTPSRRIAAVEPAAGMVRPARVLDWVRADAENLPFEDGAFDAAYSSWAYFFSRNWDPTPGLAELHRVVKPGGPLLIVDNAGGDEFCELTERDISADVAFWERRAFQTTVIETAFEFESVADARRLLELFFGNKGEAAARLRLEFKVAVFAGRSEGPGTLPA